MRIRNTGSDHNEYHTSEMSFHHPVWRVLGEEEAHFLQLLAHPGSRQVLHHSLHHGIILVVVVNVVVIVVVVIVVVVVVIVVEVVIVVAVVVEVGWFGLRFSGQWYIFSPDHERT